jgi:hypothetical protein
MSSRTSLWQTARCKISFNLLTSFVVIWALHLERFRWRAIYVSKLLLFAFIADRYCKAHKTGHNKGHKHHKWHIDSNNPYAFFLIFIIKNELFAIKNIFLKIIYNYFILIQRRLPLKVEQNVALFVTYGALLLAIGMDSMKICRLVTMKHKLKIQHKGKTAYNGSRCPFNSCAGHRHLQMCVDSGIYWIFLGKE